MNMDFKSAEELLNLCEENQLPISEVMRQRECLLGEVPRDSVNHRMGKAWEIMRSSATQPLKKPIKSMGGLIGGEAKKLEAHDAKNKSICGDVLEKAITYAMAVLEVNASMGLIVAAPTAGSAGVVPGMMLWINYFRIGSMKNTLVKIDGWIRTRMRIIIWKQWKVRTKRMWGLRKLGVPEWMARQSVAFGDHYQAVAKTAGLRRITKEILAKRGLISCVDYYLN